MEVEKPNREPDIHLPYEASISDVYIWIEERVFAIGGLDNCHDFIKSNAQEFNTVTEYLEFCVNRGDTPKRSQIAATYIIEDAINKGL